MEGLSRKSAYHFYVIFKQRILSVFFPSFDRNMKLSLSYTKGQQKKWRKKAVFFLNTNILNNSGEVIAAGKLIHLSAPPAAYLHPAGCFATSFAPTLCATAGFSSSWNIRRALHTKHGESRACPSGRSAQSDNAVQ